MSGPIYPSKPGGHVAPMTNEELEAGLRILAAGKVDEEGFWLEKGAAFRETVLLAIRETSDALLSPSIPLRWHAELESQLEELLHSLVLANRQIAAQRRPAHIRPN